MRLTKLCWILFLLDCCLLSFVSGGPLPGADYGKVIVVGAGVGGLTVSSQLHNAGFDVQLFEAQDRIGGRTWTVQMGGGQYIEMGAEWIHGEKENSVFELLSPLGVLQDRRPNEFGNQFGFQNGQLLNESLSHRLHELLDYMWYDPEGWGNELETDVSMGDFARFILNKYQEHYPFHDNQTFLEAAYDWAHRVTNAEDASFNWFEKSATEEGEQYTELEGFANIPWKPPYGFHSLHQLLLTGTVTETGEFDLPPWIHLNSPVRKIMYSTTPPTSVTVTLENGTSYTADHVVWTGSLGVLKDQHTNIFEPPLSPKKQSAIEHLGFGTVSKISYEFENAWWNPGWEGLFLLWNDHDYQDPDYHYWKLDITLEELMKEVDDDGLPLWTRSLLNIFTVDSGSAPNVVRLWLTGMPSQYLDLMDPDYLETTIMKVIHKFLDSTFPNITKPIGRIQSKWASNPYTQGTYSYRTMDSELYDVWARDLAEPILGGQGSNFKPLICFAGEATHPIYFSTVHGAYDTGMREFQRINSSY